MINKIYDNYKTLKQVSVENILDKTILDIHSLNDEIQTKKLCTSILSEVVILRPFNDKKFFELDSKTKMLVYIIIELSNKMETMNEHELDMSFTEVYKNSLDGKYNEIEIIYDISKNLVQLCSEK